MKTLALTMFLTVIFFNFTFTGCGKKEEDVSTSKDTKSNTQTQTQSNVSSPKIGMIWTQVEKKNEALGQIIKVGKAGHFDEPIAEVINLLKTLPAKSTGLEQFKQELLKTKIAGLESIGKSMDELHHSKKSAEVKKEYEKFTQNIRDIKNIYPQDSFQ